MTREYLEDQTPGWLLIGADTQSGLKELESGPLRVKEEYMTAIWQDLITLATAGWNVVLMFVYSHVGGAPRNERVDKACETHLDSVSDQEVLDAPVWQTDVVRLIRQELRSEWMDSPGVKQSSRQRLLGQTKRGAPLRQMHDANMPRTQQIDFSRARTNTLRWAGPVYQLQMRSPPHCRLCGLTDAHAEVTAPQEKQSTLDAQNRIYSLGVQSARCGLSLDPSEIPDRTMRQYLTRGVDAGTQHPLDRHDPNRATHCVLLGNAMSKALSTERIEELTSTLTEGRMLWTRLGAEHTSAKATDTINWKKIRTVMGKSSTGTQYANADGQLECPNCHFVTTENTRTRAHKEWKTHMERNHPEVTAESTNDHVCWGCGTFWPTLDAAARHKSRCDKWQPLYGKEAPLPAHVEREYLKATEGLMHWSSCGALADITLNDEILQNPHALTHALQKIETKIQTVRSGESRRQQQPTQEPSEVL